MRRPIAAAAALALAAGAAQSVSAGNRPVFSATPLRSTALPGAPTASAGAVFPLPAGTSSGPALFLALPTDPSGAPTALRPNAPGAIRLPAAWTKPPAVPEQLDEPTLRSLWEKAGAAYGIPWFVLAAINKIESNFGRNMGPSSAGAIGWMQFMPATWLRWGVDANHDGVADPWNAEDAVYSAARYLAASGGATDVRRAIFSYNHLDWYVNEVIDLAGLYSTAGVDGTFRLDRMQQQVSSATGRLLAVNRALLHAKARLRVLARLAARAQARADGAKLLSDRLDLQRPASAALGLVLDQRRVVATLARRVAKARGVLIEASSAARSASFVPAAATLLGGPAYSSGYVFPVGGGPARVSVAHTHHDFPAADIAAPSGSPVYALADAVVLDAWPTPAPDGQCGLGVRLQTTDGLDYTYCHLSFLDPSVTPGARVQAGRQIGLVGQTGNATGPHLHLQLDPPTTYPQELPWFQRFAGSAFRWQDAATPADAVPAPATAAAATSGRVIAVQATAGPVFAVVPTGGTSPGTQGGAVVTFRRDTPKGG